MKTKTFQYIAVSGLMAITLLPEAIAQLGMDYAGFNTTHYSRLRRAAISFQQNSQNEKAMGVYTAEIFPSSMFEVNTTTFYSPFIHPNLGGDRGRVFRTAAPAGFTQQWQMFRGVTPVGRLFNLLNTDILTLESSLGDMTFNTGGANVRMRINTFGSGTQGIVDIFGPPTGTGVSLFVRGGGDVLLNPGGSLFFDGNYSYAAGNYIRPIALNTQQFVTSGTERMRITPAGRVGINNTIPQGTLHISSLNGKEAIVIGNGTPEPTTPPSTANSITFTEQNTGTGNNSIRWLNGTGGFSSAIFGNTFQSNHMVIACNGGNVGVGFDFASLNSFPPQRSVDILDNSPAGNLPQLRLTRIQNDNPALGIFTDFQTTNLGDLFINARSNGNPRNVGIQTIVPGNTLEINSLSMNPCLPNAGGGTGFSGLRFTDLRATCTPYATNPGTGVLALDNIGDVIYVPRTFNCWDINQNDICDAGEDIDGIPGCDNLDCQGTGGGADGDWFDNSNAPPPLLSGTTTNIYHLGTAAVGAVAPASSQFFTFTNNQLIAGNFLNENTSCDASDINKFVVGVKGEANNDLPCAIGVLGKAYNAGVFIGKLITTATSVTTGWVVPSDNFLKKDTTLFTRGIDVLRQIHPMQFRYNGKSLFDTSETYFGVFADELKQIDSNAVTQFVFPLDTTAANINAVKTDYMLYTSINAIKELDSVVTQVTSVPAAPVLISPADGSVGDFRGATFTWHSVSPGIVLYRAQIAKDSAFSNIVIDQTGITDTSTSIGVCDTIPNTVFYWRVNAKNNAGTGPFSQVFSFTDTSKCSRTTAAIGRETAVAFESTSDSSFKTNLAPITNAIDKVFQLNGVYYDWVQTPGYELDSTRQIGLIAQNVQTVVPEVVHTDINGFLTLDYGRMVPVLVEAIKEQKNTIDSLSFIITSMSDNYLLQQNQLDSIENCLANLPQGLGCDSGNMQKTGSGYENQKYCITSVITIEPDNTVVNKETLLDQNKPNPFRYRTQFDYYIGEEGYVELFISNEAGQQITTLVNEQQEEGSYSVDWNTTDIAPGFYFYTLKVDGMEWVKKAIRVK